MTSAELAYRTTNDQVEHRNELVMSELAQVAYTARRIRERLPQHVELEDLVQAGVLGLIDAAAKFDGTKDVKFATFAKFRINGAILDSLRKLDWGSRTLRRKSRGISQAVAKISSTLGRHASHEEIASELGVSSEELHDTVNQLNSLCIFGQITDSSSEPGSTQDLIESAPGKGDDNPFDLCLKSENRALLISAFEVLSDREQKVVQLYYEEELTMREIAEVFGLTVTRISQVHADAIVKLRRAMGHPQPPTLAARPLPGSQRRGVNPAPALRHA
jgi:RNA polymerase sigma factor for flagellar operon FliA